MSKKDKRLIEEVADTLWSANEELFRDHGHAEMASILSKAIKGALDRIEGEDQPASLLIGGEMSFLFTPEGLKAAGYGRTQEDSQAEYYQSRIQSLEKRISELEARINKIEINNTTRR